MKPLYCPFNKRFTFILIVIGLLMLLFFSARGQEYENTATYDNNKEVTITTGKNIFGSPLLWDMDW